MSARREAHAYRVVGGIVPPSLEAKIRSEDLPKESLAPKSYHLAIGENLRDGASRAWSYLKAAYHGWREAQEQQPGGMDDTRAQLARERWLLVLLREFGYGTVRSTSGGITIDGQNYPVSHLWENVPVHLLGPGVPLDRRSPRVAGAARQPQAMVQELLNRTDEHLWALVSNGRRLRLLRDSTELVGSAYIEFDLEAIFDGELFADFFLMWRLAHSSRLEKRSGAEAAAADCWLESWRIDAHESGTRALKNLSDGVERALETLGNGFLNHPKNAWLAEALRSGELSARDYYRSLLRLAYRMIFLFVAEDRDALLDPQASPVARSRYDDYFSTDRLRRLARERSGSTHGDLWHAQTVVLHALGGDGKQTGRGEPALGLPALSGLFDPDRRMPTVKSAPEADLLTGAELTNFDFLGAIRGLAWFRPDGARMQRVDYRGMGSEELGSVYESLLELEARIDLDRGTFSISHLAGNERKTTGSYYTPASLVNTLLDSSLDPLLDRSVKEAVDDADAERRLLQLTVCDPACGSGHFLVAATRRIANRLAAVRSGEDQPSDDDVRHALRDAVSRCIYGVDLNDMAAELAKVSLWMEALEPGKPLSVLEANIRIGNSLLGVTPRLLANGVPDDAFKTIEGDDAKAVTFLKKQNNAERGGQGDLLASSGMTVANTFLGHEVATLLATPSDTVDDVHAQAERLNELERSADLQHSRLLADTWCAAFVQPKTVDTVDSAITHGMLQLLADEQNGLNPTVQRRVEALAREYGFFHWHLEFPHIFSVSDGLSSAINDGAGWVGGFDCVIGNPPWERVKLQEKEFFAAWDLAIANARNAAARKKLIVALDGTDPGLAAKWWAAKRKSEGASHMIRNSGRFPLCGVGDVNTYSVFAEHFRTTIATDGRIGIITPTGLATSDTTSAFFRDVIQSRCLVAFFDFANHRINIFEDLKGQSWFALTILTGGEHVEESRFAIDLASPDEVDANSYSLDPTEITLLNPNTGTLPLFHSRTDAKIALGIYHRHPVLIRDGGNRDKRWSLRFGTLFHMANDSGVFWTTDDLDDQGAEFDGWAWVKGSKRWLPLYEAKMLSIYNDRFGNYRDVTITPGRDVRAIPTPTESELADPQFATQSRYWVAEEDVEDVLAGRWDRGWLFGWRDVTNVTNARTFMPSILPRAAVGHVFPVVLLERLDDVVPLQAVWSSFACDYVVRQKLSGTHMTYGVLKQIACPTPETFEQVEDWCGGMTLREWVLPRVLELSCTSWRVLPYAIDLGDHGAPFQWLSERRELLRAELDASMMHVYGLTRPEVEHVLDSFFALRDKDEREHGEFRTKRLILEIYDAMAKAIKTGESYETILDPPPGQGPRHPESSRPEWAKREVSAR